MMGRAWPFGPQWAPLRFKAQLLTFWNFVEFFKAGPSGLGEEMTGKGFPCGGRRGPHPEAGRSLGTAPSVGPLPGPAPGRSRPDPSVSAPGRAQPGLGSRPLLWPGPGEGEGRRAGVRLGVRVWRGPQGEDAGRGGGLTSRQSSRMVAASRRGALSCPPRLSPADQSEVSQKKNAPRAARPRSRPEPPRGKEAAPRGAGRARGPLSGDADCRGVRAASSAPRPAEPPSREGGAARTLRGCAEPGRPAVGTGAHRGLPAMPGRRICSPSSAEGG